MNHSLLRQGWNGVPMPLLLPLVGFAVGRAEAAHALLGKQEEFRTYYETNRFSPS